jgi:molybdopterin-containing oxidoreductase family molybdopterin binding subunit
MEDAWIPTQCGMCYAECGIKVRRINGIAAKIEGNEETWMGARGGICGKGAAGLQLLYDPNRLKYPLRRTNPKKGLEEDPKWKRISWNEALDEIADRLKKVIDDDPRKLLLQGTTTRSMSNAYGFKMPLTAMSRSEKGAPQHWSSGGALHCGNGAHLVAGMVHASWSIVPDFNYCNYAIYFGASKGTGAGHSAAITMRLAADSRARGMKTVVFDPICNFSGGKATEWVPLIPGTDGAIALAMCNIILNELGVCDYEYIKWKTNGPYLVRENGHYMRDAKSRRPLVWDPVEKQAQVYDKDSISDLALEGSFIVNNEKCEPAFALIKRHLKNYSLEFASRVSDVPTETIRRIAEEFADAAMVGATIEIDGHKLPLRPASAVIFRGGQGHTNSTQTCFAVSLLNQIVGSADVPGGTLGWPARCHGYKDTNKPNFTPEAGEDGFIVTKQWLITGGHKPWPVPQPEHPKDLSLRELFTMNSLSPVYGFSDQEEVWNKLNIPFRIEMVMGHGSNIITSVANREIIADNFKKVPFTVVFELFNNEFTEGFADIVLPDTSFLETFTWLEGYGFFFNYPFGMEPWCFHVFQPVVEPMFERRYFSDVIIELAERIGRLDRLNEFWNKFIGFDDNEKIKSGERISWNDLGDKALKSMFGVDHGLEYFKKKGFIKWPKKVDEVYWRSFVNARAPIYLEFLIDVGKKTEEVVRKAGLDLEFEQFTPLVSWFPPEPHKVKDTSYDLYAFSYRDIIHTGSMTQEIPWIDEASAMNPYTYNISINSRTAKDRGLRDGEKICIETITGRKVQGRLKTMEGIHPSTVAIAACSGHWAKGLPIAKGKGTNFDILLESDWNHVDPLSLNMETCVRVKVSKGN